MPRRRHERHGDGTADGRIQPSWLFGPCGHLILVGGRRRIQSMRYRRLVATSGAPPGAGTSAFTKGMTDGITLQAGQGFRPKPQGQAAHRGGQGTGQQAREPSQGQGVRTALHEEALAPSLARPTPWWWMAAGLFTNRRPPARSAASPSGSCPRGETSPTTSLTLPTAGAVAVTCGSSSYSPAVPPTCHKQRSPAVRSG